MALWATHIRFALDLQKEYEVKNIEEYILGTVYPDSRYVTGVDRNLTHGDFVMSKNFIKDDFKKGWQVHQICDTVQHKVFRKNILFLDRHTDDGWEENKWVEFTAAKIIQDMDDMQHFNIQNYLAYFKKVYNPNGENKNKMKQYNNIVINLYKDKQVTSLDDNYRMWLSLGINKKLGMKVKGKVNEFLKDKKLVFIIQSTYKDMLKFYKN